MMGELVFSSELQTTNYKLDLRNESNGIYFVRITTKEGVVSRKIIKE